MTVWLLLDFSVYFKPHLFAEYCQLTSNTKTYHFLSVHITLTSKLCWIWERWKKELQKPQIVGKKCHLFWLSFPTNIIYLDIAKKYKNHCNESGNYDSSWHLKIKSDRCSIRYICNIKYIKIKGTVFFSDLLCGYICCICLIYWNLL